MPQAISSEKIANQVIFGGEKNIRVREPRIIFLVDCCYQV